MSNLLQEQESNMQFLLIYVIAGIVVYIYYAEKIQRDFDCMYTGGKNFLANVIAVMLVVDNT